ncbi:molecular chaperone [Novosphingobium sp. 1949]|uniref:Molecular chaperone n=1 Tax=Novosphingobium organovorum TaxID=2930092 RepID=A0ABT0BG38_9SPHN|nr:ATP12 family protein [Novosphingobium organovorum]MCJ2183885.1 molecular chaperone [Novosphingobium organovorum]
MKRFYKTVTIAPAATGSEEGWCVQLDARPIKTAGGRPQVVPTRALAEALAAEWEAQGEEIDPRDFVTRDLVDFALDAVAPDTAGAIAEILPYADTDTLCYRADPEEAIYKRQLAIWEPLLSETEARLGVRFARVSGILHRAHPDETLARIKAELDGLDPVTLAALRMLASLAASLVIALAALREDADAQGLWRAANLEEDWQVELWGEDAEAAQNRQARFEAFQLAMRVARLARA